MIPGLGRTGFDRNITLWGIFVPGTKDEVKSPWNWDWNSAKELLKYVSCIYICYMYNIYIYIHFTMMYHSEVYPNTCCWFLILHPWEAPDFASAGPSRRGSPSIQLLSWEPPLSSLLGTLTEAKQFAIMWVPNEKLHDKYIYRYIYIYYILYIYVQYM